MKTDSYNELFEKGDEVYELEPNFILGGFDIKNIHDFLLLFEEEFQAFYCFSVKAFIMFLAFLGYKIMDAFATSYHAQCSILNRAYIVGKFDIKEFSEDFNDRANEFYRLIFKEEIKEQIDISIILNTFLLTTSNQNDINLWTRGPKRFLYQISKDHMIFDYSCLTDIVSYIVKTITSTDGDVGNRRAISFENAIVAEIGQLLPSDKIWKCGKEIEANKNKKEIDASFVLGDVLVILEAKAVNVSLGFDKGDSNAVSFRKKKMKEAIREVDEKAIFIKNNYESLKAELPTGVSFVCPLVISSYPEFIWERTEELFISEKMNLPRIINIADLREIVKIERDDLIRRNYCLSVMPE